MPHMPTSRRTFLQLTGLTVTGLATLPAGRLLAADKAPFEISLAEWSLHKTIFGKQLDHLDFPKAAKEQFGISAVEHVNQFFKDKAHDEKYLADLKRRADDHGVKSLLIMCDGEGQLGDPDSAKRTEAVTNHHKWVDAAKALGCHSIRVNAGSDGKLSYEEQQKLAADGLSRLTEYGEKANIAVIVENHGGLSSNGAWLAGVMKLVNKPLCGTLPDFGNFRVSDKEEYDRYKGTAELMPFAKGVSAKSYDFNEAGDETTIDYRKMLKIVLDAGYKGYIGIEYEGGRLSEADGILATKKLLDKLRGELA
ncbi:MAG: sugar phosphate isomerase/epimerase family protein [Pirellulales bacterium]|nr:sugar phosphate isomerase/epimerase family protein [Pirellulales bacterium]